MVDNMMVHHRAWQRKLKSLGMDLTLEEVRQQIHGVNEEILARLFGDRFNAEERARLANEKEEEYRRIFKPELRLIDGLDNYIKALYQSGIPMAIGSAAPIENVDFVLEGLNLQKYFRATLHAGSVRRGKPDPEIYIKAAERLGFAANECLIFEDSPTGVEAAQRCGGSVIVVTTTHTEKEFSKFDHIIKFITNYAETDLFQVTENLFSRTIG